MALSEENSHFNSINFNNLFYESPQAMWVLEIDSLKFLEVNEAAIRSYGYSKEEFLSMTLQNILVEGDHPYLHSDHFRSNETTTLESHHRLKSSEHRRVEVTSFPFIFEGKACKLIYVRDITIKKKREALLQYLTNAGEELAVERNTKTLLAKISDLVVPKFADWFTINIVRGEIVELLLVKNADPDYIVWAHDYRKRNPITIHEGGLTGHVIRTGESNLTPVVTPEMLEQAITDKEQLEVIRRLNLRSSIVTPMKVDGKVIGTINYISTVEGKQYDELDLKFAQDLSTRIALALENAKLHEEAKVSLEELKEAEQNTQAMNEELAAINEELSSVNEQLVETHVKALESEERFRRMAEETDVLIAVADETSNASYFNKAWSDLTGRSMEELLEFGWVDLVHPEDKERFVNIYLDAFKERVPFKGEFRVLNKEGEYTWLLAKGPPRFHADGSFAGYISSCVDITELKKDEARKNDFIGMVSHELKTPLTSLTALLQVSQRKLKDTSDQFLKDAMSKANDQVRKMSKMINAFLNISRLESGKISIDRTEFDLKVLVEQIVEEANLTHTKRIKFNLGESIVISADREKIGSVISNLLSNSLKYSSQDKPIELRCEKGNDYIRVSVIDGGIGIKEEDKKRIFERYYRVASKSSEHISGFGIGLYLSAEIIERHSGTIGVESTFGDGSTFFFTLPIEST